MVYLTCLWTLGLCFCFHPLYNNYTSLLNTKYAILFYIWIILLDLSLFQSTMKYILQKKEKYFLYLLAVFFTIGSFVPYESPFYYFSYIHVMLPMICLIIYVFYLFYLIYHFHKKEPLKAHLLYQWFFWEMSIISMMIIFFGHINGIIEMTIIFFIFFMLYKMNIIDDS